jgi:methyl-accepting chemotaxis protein
MSNKTRLKNCAATWLLLKDRIAKTEVLVSDSSLHAGVKDGVESTVQAGDALREIIHMAEQVGDMITQIATAGT